MRFSLWISLVFVLSTATQAAILEFSGNPARTIDVGDFKVPVYPSAQIKLKEGKPPATSLKLTGAGIRKKKVVLVNIKAYALASYVENPAIIDTAAPMEGLRKNKAKALVLTFLRDIDSGKIQSSFRESLEKNGADMKSAPIQQVFSKLTFDMPEKSTMTILGYQKSPSLDVLVFEVPSGTFQIEGKDLSSTFWSIWFGKPLDGGIEELQAQLLPQPKTKATSE